VGGWPRFRKGYRDFSDTTKKQQQKKRRWFESLLDHPDYQLEDRDGENVRQKKILLK